MLLISYLHNAVTSWRHVMTSQNLIYLSQLVDVLERCFFFCFHGISGHWVRKCYWFFSRVMTWRHDVMSWRHKTNLTISACRCAKKLILFLFPWVFWSLSSKMSLIFHLCDDVTSWRHVMTSKKPDLPISDCRCARTLLLFLFPWFYRSLSSDMLLILHLLWCRDVMTSCHDVTKPDLPSSACRCARKMIIFLFPWFFWSLSSKMLLIFNLCDVLASWRHVLTSQKIFTYPRMWNARKMILFMIPWFLWLLILKMLVFMYFVGWYHVMTSRHDVTSILSITLQHFTNVLVGP